MTLLANLSNSLYSLANQGFTAARRVNFLAITTAIKANPTRIAGAAAVAACTGLSIRNYLSYRGLDKKTASLTSAIDALTGNAAVETMRFYDDRAKLRSEFTDNLVDLAQQLDGCGQVVKDHNAVARELTRAIKAAKQCVETEIVAGQSEGFGTDQAELVTLLQAVHDGIKPKGGQPAETVALVKSAFVRLVEQAKHVKTYHELSAIRSQAYTLRLRCRHVLGKIDEPEDATPLLEAIDRQKPIIARELPLFAKALHQALAKVNLEGGVFREVTPQARKALFMSIDRCKANSNLEAFLGSLVEFEQHVLEHLGCQRSESPLDILGPLKRKISGGNIVDRNGAMAALLNDAIDWSGKTWTPRYDDESKQLDCVSKVIAAGWGILPEFYASVIKPLWGVPDRLDQRERGWQFVLMIVKLDCGPSLSMYSTQPTQRLEASRSG